METRKISLYDNRIDEIIFSIDDDEKLHLDMVMSPKAVIKENDISIADSLNQQITNFVHLNNKITPERIEYSREENKLRFVTSDADILKFLKDNNFIIEQLYLYLIRDEKIKALHKKINIELESLPNNIINSKSTENKSEHSYNLFPKNKEESTINKSKLTDQSNPIEKPTSTLPTKKYIQIKAR